MKVLDGNFSSFCLANMINYPKSFKYKTFNRGINIMFASNETIISLDTH